MASALQSTGQARVQGGLNATTNLAQQQADQTRQILSDTAGIDNMDDTQLQALAGKYGVTLEELKSVISIGGDVVSLLMKALPGGK